MGKATDVLDLLESSVKTKYDKQYQDLLIKVKGLPWDGKMDTWGKGAEWDIDGTINDKKVSFGYQKPDTKWAPLWMFVGANIAGRNYPSNFVDIQDATGTIKNFKHKITSDDIKNYKITPDVEKLVSKNMQQFQRAIDVASKLK